jgi:hypothetical protein
MNHTTYTRALLLALGLGGAIAATLVSPPPAHADPVVNYALSNAYAVCETLDDYPSFQGIEGVATAIVRDTGWNYTQAGSVIVTSIQLDCSRHQALWNCYVDTYGPNSATGPNPAPAPAPAPRQQMQEAV